MRLPRLKIPISSDALIEWLSRIIPLAIIVGVVSLLKERGIWDNPNFQKALWAVVSIMLTIILAFLLYKGVRYVKTVVGNLIENRPRTRKAILISYILVITFSLLGGASLTVIVGLTFIFGAVYILLFK